ncbi:DUF1287 domain-containing protein [Bacteroidota bacterium]
MCTTIEKSKKVKMMALFILLLNICIFACKNDNANTTNINFNDSIKQERSDTNNTLTENQRKILLGAKKTVEDGADYDLTMGYYVLKYKDGEYSGNKVYPEGDLDPGIGVCTDVLVRALRYAGIVDLQKAIHEDIKINWSDYPTSRWGSKKPDSNIDHRRIMNLEIWFSKFWKEVGYENFEPGDIVVWDMNQDGASDHTGIISDKFENGRYYVIHSHPDPGFTAEEDKLFRWEMTGHFRIQD